MKKILSITTLINTLIFANCDYNKNEVEKTSYYGKPTNIYKNKTICVSGKVVEKVNRSITLYSDYFNGEKIKDYVLFNIFEKKHIETLKKIPYINIGDNVDLICEFGVDAGYWYGNCQFKENTENNNTKEIKAEKWYLVSFKTLNKLDKTKLKIIWAFEDEEWKVTTDINTSYKKIEDYKDSLGYWILPKENTTYIE